MLSEHGLLTDDIMYEFQNPNWRSNIFKKRSNFPMLIPASEDPNYYTKQRRYYANTILRFNDEEYQITSQWYEPEYRHYRSWLKRFIGQPNNAVVSQPVEVKPEPTIDDKITAAIQEFAQLEAGYFPAMKSILEPDGNISEHANIVWVLKGKVDQDRHTWINIFSEAQQIKLGKDATSHRWRGSKEAKLSKILAANISIRAIQNGDV